MRRIALLVVVPVLLVGVAWRFGIGPLAIAVYALAVVMLAGLAMSIAWAAPLEVRRELNADVLTLGDRLQVVVQLRNPLWWPVPWVYVEETLPPRFPAQGTTRRLLFLPPRHTFYLTYSIVPPSRGFHQIGPLVIETGDIFGLFRRCRVHPSREFITVLSRYQIIEEFGVGRLRKLGGMTARRSLLEDPTRIVGVREYRRGDPLNHIHWRTSARLGAMTGQLATRLFEPVTDAGATILLDFHEASCGECPTHRRG